MKSYKKKIAAQLKPIHRIIKNLNSLKASMKKTIDKNDAKYKELLKKADDLALESNSVSVEMSETDTQIITIKEAFKIK